MKTNVRKDSELIVNRLKDRNPLFTKCIQDGTISLEDFAEVVIVQYLAFNNIKR